MRHVILTCKNHPDLRWSCKEIAFTPGYGYNELRNIWFNGRPTGKGMYHDGSGLDCDHKGKECPCPPTDLVLAPEDEFVIREDESREDWLKRVGGKINVM